MSAADAIARALIAAWGSGRPIDHRTLPPVPDEATAYAVQAAVAAALGPVGGYKAGRAAPEAPLILAPILARGVRQTGAAIPFAESRLRGVELEVGFRIDAPLPRPGTPDFRARLAAAVTPLAAIEIVESRLEDPDAAGPLWKLADAQVNGGLICGAPGRLPDALEASLSIGGEAVVSGPATNPAGPPWDVLADFVALAHRLAVPAGPGQVVITGSLTGLRHARAGQEVRGTIGGLGAVSCRFEGADQ